MTSWFFYIIILTALTISLAVQEIPDFDVETFHEKLNWTDVHLEEVASPHLTNALESIINGLGGATYSFLKWIAEWSSQNPQIPFKLLIWLTLFAITAPIILLLVKLSIIIFLLTKEYFQNRKEKKELNRLRRLQNA